MRLIDTDEVINILKETGIIQDNELGHCVIAEINRIPTAYDVDKVVEELERLKETEQGRKDECDEEGYGDAEQIFSDGESQGKFRAYIKAIEVVKAGGINNNVSKKM